jgi:hypothetical protein
VSVGFVEGVVLEPQPPKNALNVKIQIHVPTITVFIDSPLEFEKHKNMIISVHY